MDVKYRLESITETEYRFNYDFCYESIVPDVVSIQIGHTMKPLMDEDRLVVSVRVNIVHSETDTILATNTVTLAFGLSPIKEILSLDNNGNLTTQNTLILDTFMVTAIGALRGVLMKNLKGTPLDFVTIPLIPIENFRKQNA